MPTVKERMEQHPSLEEKSDKKEEIPEEANRIGDKLQCSKCLKLFNRVRQYRGHRCVKEESDFVDYFTERSASNEEAANNYADEPGADEGNVAQHDFSFIAVGLLIISHLSPKIL